MNPATLPGFASGLVVGFMVFLLVARIMVAIEDRQRHEAKRTMNDLQAIFDQAKADVTKVVTTASKKMEKQAGRRVEARR